MSEEQGTSSLLNESLSLIPRQDSTKRVQRQQATGPTPPQPMETQGSPNPNPNQPHGKLYCVPINSVYYAITQDPNPNQPHGKLYCVPINSELVQYLNSFLVCSLVIVESDNVKNELFAAHYTLPLHAWLQVTFHNMAHRIIVLRKDR